jgi:hypothetical protein
MYRSLASKRLQLGVLISNLCVSYAAELRSRITQTPLRNLRLRVIKPVLRMLEPALSITRFE